LFVVAANVPFPGETVDPGEAAPRAAPVPGLEFLKPGSLGDSAAIPSEGEADYESGGASSRSEAEIGEHGASI
jgi:hypothetical protein